MSEPERQYTELVTRGLEAYNRGDLRFILELSAEDIEVHAHPGLMNSGDYKGREEFEGWLTEWQEAWSELILEVRDAHQVGDRYMLLEIFQRGVGASSGVPVEMETVQLFELVDGEVARFHLYPDLETAREALEALE